MIPRFNPPFRTPFSHLYGGGFNALSIVAAEKQAKGKLL